MTSTGYHQARTADLTARQREVLALIAKGHTNAQIAEQLGVSLDGAKWHVREILSRLDVETREEAAAWWKREHAPWRRVARGFGFGALPATAGVVGAAAVVVVGVLAAVVLIASLNRAGDAPVAVDPTETPVVDETPTPEPVSPTPGPTVTGTTPVAGEPPGHEPGTEVGIPNLDSLVDALQSGEPDRIASFISYSMEPCGVPRPIDRQQLICGEGQQSGDLVAGLPITQIEGGLWREHDAPLLVGESFGGRKLYGIWTVSDPSGGADYGLLFPSADRTEADGITFVEFDTVYVRDGQIVSILFSFPEDGLSLHDPHDPGWAFTPPPVGPVSNTCLTSPAAIPVTWTDGYVIDWAIFRAEPEEPLRVRNGATTLPATLAIRAEIDTEVRLSGTGPQGPLEFAFGQGVPSADRVVDANDPSGPAAEQPTSWKTFDGESVLQGAGCYQVWVFKRGVLRGPFGILVEIEP